jgi:hypothetical protein
MTDHDREQLRAIALVALASTALVLSALAATLSG